MQSREFKEILGPKAFKFLKIGFQSCKDQVAEAGLFPADADTDFPSIDKAIAAVPDNILEEELEAGNFDGQDRNEDEGDQGETEAPK